MKEFGKNCSLEERVFLAVKVDAVRRATVERVVLQAFAFEVVEMEIMLVVTIVRVITKEFAQSFTVSASGYIC